MMANGRMIVHMGEESSPVHPSKPLKDTGKQVFEKAKALSLVKMALVQNSPLLEITLIDRLR